MRDERAARRLPALVDLLLVAAVPVALAAVHLGVPGPVQARYVLAPDAPTPTTLFTAAFLHVSDAHLLGNVVGYLLGALSAALLCLLLAERRWFRLSLVALVLGLPVLVNWTSLQVLRWLFADVSVPIRGFSGVTAGVGGFTLAALVALVDRRTDRWTALFSGLAAVLLLFWEVRLVYAVGLPVDSTAMVAVGLALCLVAVARRVRFRGLPERREGWLQAGLVWLLFAWTLLVLGVLVAGLFPADPVHDGRITNVYAHAIGFALGAVVSGWGYRYWRTTAP